MSTKALSSAQIAAAGARYLAGERVADLAEEYGVAENTLRRYFREADIRKAHRPTAESLAASNATPADFAEVLAARPDPGDSLGAGEWMYQLLAYTATLVMEDDSFTGREHMRRKELREIASAMARLQPVSALFDARRLILADSDELQRPKFGPQTEKVGPRRHQHGPQTVSRANRRRNPNHEDSKK